MSENVSIGLLFVFAAGVLQGSFVLPMTLTRCWAWEHNWAVFSLLGMLLFNWLFASLAIPSLSCVYQNTPDAVLRVLVIFGGLWGMGAVLFGLGMARLGMALGYPVIMGLILILGALIPLLLQNPRGLLSRTGMLLLAATAVTLVGVTLCSRAAAYKHACVAEKSSRIRLGSGLTIAIFAGILSCLPNVGMNYAWELKSVAIRHGASITMAGNAVWALVFTAGFAVNILYCASLMLRRGNLRVFASGFGRNVGLMALMALMWIASFYIYGMGAARMGRWGGIIGWPLFISLSIMVGNLWGLARGEWSGASCDARRLLKFGLGVLLLAVILFGVSGT